MAIYNFSPSLLNIFRDCPRCFWLQINKNIKRPRGPYPSIATGLDSVVKRYFDECRKKGEFPSFLKEKISGRLVPEALRYALRFNDLKNDLNFYGYLDECIILEDKFYAPLDNKTRASLPQDVHPAYQLQMDCYSFLLQKNKYPTNNKGYLVYYSPRSVANLLEGIKFDFKVLELDTRPERVQEILYKALKVAKDNIPNSAKTCEFCKWVDSLGKI